MFSVARIFFHRSSCFQYQCYGQNLIGHFTKGRRVLRIFKFQRPKLLQIGHYPPRWHEYRKDWTIIKQFWSIWVSIKVCQSQKNAINGPLFIKSGWTILLCFIHSWRQFAINKGLEGSFRSPLIIIFNFSPFLFPKSSFFRWIMQNYLLSCYPVPMAFFGSPYPSENKGNFIRKWLCWPLGHNVIKLTANQ